MMNHDVNKQLLYVCVRDRETKVRMITLLTVSERTVVSWSE